MPALRAVLKEKIEKLRGAHRLRAPSVMDRAGRSTHLSFEGKEYISFSSNDYLGLLHHPAVVQAANEAMSRYGAGAGASRLITGTHPPCDALETALAQYKGAEAACLFGSGYLANIGTIPALVGKGDLVIADKLVHACILDGIKLSGAKLLRFKHNDAVDCERILAEQRGKFENCLIITETVFSMDGDVAPMEDLRLLADTHDAWLMSDDAHGIGLISETRADIQMGTLSKALGSYGGYVAGSKELITYLQTAARSFIYSTALPPSAVAAAQAALKIVQNEPERCAKPLARARQFTHALGLPEAQSPIVPFVLGSEKKVLQASEKLKEKGFLVVAIRPPTVPEGTARLRFTFSAEHTEAEVKKLIEGVRDAGFGA